MLHFFGRNILLVLAILATGNTYAQYSTADSLPKKVLNWQNKDPKRNKVLGTSVEKTHKKLIRRKKAKKKIIVAIIDTGVDIDHEDLKGKIWTNSKEIAGNGIDDDNNGYVDDIHGWNFLGNKEGKDFNDANFEFVRMYIQLKSKYDGKSEDEVTDKNEYKTYQEIKKKFKEDLDLYSSNLERCKTFLPSVEAIEKEAVKLVGKENYTLNDLEKLNSTDSTSTVIINTATEFIKQGLTTKELKKAMKQMNNYVNVYLNTELGSREETIGDDPNNINDIDYGNNNIKGTFSSHGTFCAGIITANRKNQLGVNGITDDVEIMVIRCVPNGDEYDKDVALSIRYAVDNGAQILNMSFGKSYSPNKQMVDDAIKYATDKGVLLVHAAGNDSRDLDSNSNFPSQNYNDGNVATSFLTVGASSMDMDVNLTAPFTNYGKKNVDIFAPGKDVTSTKPNDKYASGSGTSFACPHTAGVCALIWSHFPELTAVEIKEIILESANTNYKDLKVNVPGEKADDKNRKTLIELSLTGGIVNTFKAFKMAKKLNSSKS